MIELIIIVLIKLFYILFQFILNHHFPFKLNGKVLQVLVSIFLYHDFSVRNFIKGLKVTGTSLPSLF